MPTNPDTIFALATPAGRSGVAVLRVSGPHAGAALRADRRWQSTAVVLGLSP